MTASDPLPLVDRPDGASLFRTAGRIVDVAGFLKDVASAAAALPPRGYVANLCQDRYRFAVGLAAALLRGQISLLSGDLSLGVSDWLTRQYPDAYALTDGPVPDMALPQHRIATAGKASAPAAMPAVPALQPAAVVLTSGTTGGPVGTQKCWGELVARSRAAGRRFGLTAANPATIVGTVPPGHMYGLETTVLLPLHAAASVWCGPAFFPADICAALDALPGARILVTTPLHLRALLQTAPPARPPERVVSATAPLDRALADQAERAWGTQVWEIFGATEVGSIASRRTIAGDDWELYPDVTLIAADDLASVAAPWAEPRQLNDVIEPLPGGRFRLGGRVSDLVKLGGRRASLSGLSSILTSIGGVQDGIFLAPDDLDRSPTARLVAIAVAPSHSAASLTELLRARIDPLFLPRPLVLMDSLPRNSLGKLPRATLLAALAEATAGNARGRNG